METTKRAHRSSLAAKRERWGLIFIFPQLISLVLLGLVPVVVAFGLGFTDWNGFGNMSFVGLDNFENLFNDRDTVTAIKNTFLFVFVYVPILIAFSLGLAMLLNNAFGKVFYRSVIFLPQVVNSVAIAVIWSWIYQPQFGVLNAILGLFGAPGQAWLREPTLAMGSIIAMSIWWGLGYNVVLFLAGLQNVPRVYVEAAKIDGGTPWHIFRHITLPMISPTTLFVTITTMINAFQAFDQMQLLTNGGPAKRTYTLTLHIYQTAFKEFRLGEAAAISLILFFIVVVFSVIQFILSEKYTYYGN